MSESNFLSIVDYSYPAGVAATTIADRFAQIQRDWVAQYPGFLGARFFAADGEAMVRALIEWQNEAAFRAFEKNSDTDGRIAALQQAFVELSAQGDRKTFRLVAEVRPTHTDESEATVKP